MSFSVFWHPKVRKFLLKLPKGVSRRIVLKVKAIRENPFHYLEHFEGASYYKLRVGEFRLLIDVDLSDKVLLIQVF